MLAKAEWERQLRAKLEARDRDRAEAILEAAATPEDAARDAEGAAAEPKQSLKLGVVGAIRSYRVPQFVS